MAIAALEPANTASVEPQPRKSRLSRWLELLCTAAVVAPVYSKPQMVDELKNALLLVYDYRLGKGEVKVEAYVDALERYERAMAMLLTSGFEAASLSLICAQALLDRERHHVNA